MAEVFAMVRAHVAALGGNAVVSYSMKDCVLMENPNKNQVLHDEHLELCEGLWVTLLFCFPPQCQCLINVSGDAVIYIRETDLEAIASTVGLSSTNSDGAT